MQLSKSVNHVAAAQRMKLRRKSSRVSVNVQNVIFVIYSC